MNKIEWSKKQEEIFSGRRFGVSEQEYNVRPDYYLDILLSDTEIRTRESILCLGCNDGTHVKRFFEEGYDVFGLDLQSVIERTRSKRYKIANRFISCNLEIDEIPLKRFWDLIFAKSIIEHLINWKNLPKNMYRSQLFGSMVWLSTKNGNVDQSPEPDHFIHIGWNELESIFIKVGYTIIKHYEDPLSEKGQILVAKK